MMKKAYLLVVVLVVVAAVAAFALFSPVEVDDSPVGKDILKDGIEVGDFYEFTSDVVMDGEKEKVPTRYEVLNKYSDDSFKVAVTNSMGYSEKTMSKEEFLEDLFATESNKGFKLVGKEVIDTAFGKRECNIYTGFYLGMECKSWNGIDNNVAYKQFGEGKFLGMDMKETMKLVDTNLFV